MLYFIPNSNFYYYIRKQDYPTTTVKIVQVKEITFCVVNSNKLGVNNVKGYLEVILIEFKSALYFIEDYPIIKIDSFVYKTSFKKIGDFDFVSIYLELI